MNNKEILKYFLNIQLLRGLLAEIMPTECFENRAKRYTKAMIIISMA